MEKWKWYRVKLRHAKGAVTIRTYTTSLDKAIMLVCNAEYAPRSAVVAAWESR